MPTKVCMDLFVLYLLFMKKIDNFLDHADPLTLNLMLDFSIYSIQATTHEMGHGLGLMHSSSYGAVMAPYYPGYKDDIQLSKDDLDGIHKNYGKDLPKRSSSR